MQESTSDTYIVKCKIVVVGLPRSSTMGEQFGQRRPPLSVTIKQILERYPDGQIFKEMIQNADDAGATVVQFYVDCRHHGTSGLVKPELAAYQGPALISANDAMFSEQDWEGIQSLQQSIKAEDPFKVGRFGIGFNSVYHLTDIPSIVSGNRLAFLEPQERVWEGQSGRWFSLQKLSGSDHLNCLNGISNFNSRSEAQYNKTLFRFPLRSATSNLSDNVYTLQKVNELSDALRSEAKLLLLFLRSVHTIEVYNIDRYGNHTLTFQAKIADPFVADVKQKRATLLRDLKSCHSSYGYNFTNVLKFTSKFDVCVYDANTRHTSISHWLVANQVGSSSHTVRAAAVKQKVFPWVGTAVELDNPGNGRIFCFLPMPIETDSNLPVHVNGTFGLNDDRRSLKWPGVERRNDPMADWNKMLVTEVIPSCYVKLLLEYKRFVSEKADFYKSWPNVGSLRRNTQWVSLMSPVFSSILSQGVIWCKTPMAKEWVTPGTAVYIPRSGSLPDVVKNALSTCGVKLAQVPANVWDACSHAGVPITEVTPKFVRDELRASPHSYAGAQDKRELLMYCLSDGQYSDLVNLQLLPLSDNSFGTFESCYSSAVYMCTSEFPKWLLPNLDHRLIDVTNDPDLNTTLILVAQSNCTQLTLLSVSHVATLLDEVMSRWSKQKAVSFPNQYIPSDWFEKFWNWVRNKQLQSFQNKFVLPIQRAHNVPATREFQVIRLAASQPVLYFPSHSAAGSNTMLSVLDKLGVQYCTQTSFPYVQHSQLTSYIKEYSPSALLDVMALKGSYASVSFTSQEADLLRRLFCQVRLMYQNQKTVLQSLKIFSSCINSSNGLCSISQVNKASLLKQVVVQPSITIDLSVLPSNVIILSSSDYYQNQLLHKLGHGVTDGVDFLTQHIFPKLPSMGDRYIDPIMTRVLDIYPTLRYSNTAITSGIQDLEFVKVASGARKCPCDLYDPSDASLRQIFTGQGVFPRVPYNASKYIATLRLCGLHTSVEPQAILDLIYSLSLQARSYPKAVDASKMLRVKAIMEYVSSTSFQNKASGSYTLDRRIQRGYVPFSTALNLLSTHRSWLPVLAERPSNYPGNLPWKGSGYTSHLISLQGSVCASNSSSTTLPLLYGSQVYFTETFDSVTSEEPKGCLVAHFQEVIAKRDSLTRNEMLGIICQIYYAMAEMTQSHVDVQHLKPLKTMKEWVYIKKYHKFVSIDAVALKQNPGFRHNMGPYLHILPDSISGYSQLFKAFGMNDIISESQIVSTLAVIRNEVGTNQCSVSSEEAWSTVLAILNWLTRNGTKEVDNEAIYVPAESDSQLPDLREPRDLVYTDNDFLKTVVSSDNDELLTYVHDRINQSLAKSLMITPLSEELDISEDTFEDAGQHEPLIVRLKNILRDYKDGLTIVKELIQNADDAEATEVNICFDNRQHTSERNRLFFPDMCDSHGPALVIHNNSQFSDEDFANIQKLAGGTKQRKHLKIGKFGIGFCSVYHITDVPSFVSRERLYIFDPTLNHLRKAVRNPSQPGKRVNYPTKFIQKSKQMEPYEGLFGFKKAMKYNGTMFRLPFRTNASELSSTCYSQSTFMELLTSIQESGDKLLLFLQNVQRITVQQFDVGMTAPKVLYELRRHVPQPLDNASIVTMESKSAGKSSKVPKSWLVASYSTTYDKKPALANVACSLNTSHGSYTVNSDLTGEMFCFLPLSQATGLPVHVSCNFAVINNRRGIWTSAQEGTSIFDPEVQWNVFLMKNVIPVAYSKLLNSLKILFEDGSLPKYNFYSLWPLTSELIQRNPWKELVKMLYASLVQVRLFYSESTSQWLSMRESKFLDPDILGQPGSLPCVLDVIHHLNLPLVELPSSYKAHLNLARQSLSEKEFVELFTANLSRLSSIRVSRNDVIMYILEAYATQYDDGSELACLLEKKFSSHAFIPTAPDGRMLRKCTDIVSPEATFAGLFDVSDHIFPLKTLADRHLVMTALEQAGMMDSTLKWDFIIDRAQSVEALMEQDRVKALERVRLIVKTLSDSVDGKPPSSGTTIDSVKFLPVMRKPKHYPLSWYGDGCKLLSGRQLILSEVYTYSRRDTMERIAGSQAAFLCENLPKEGGCGYINNYETRKLLRLRDYPTLCEVTEQLKAIIDQFNSSSPPSLEWITISCEEIYKFMERAVGDGGTNLDELKEIECIWNGRMFLDTNSIALNWKLSDGPYLYTAPPSVASKEKLSKFLGIKENFTSEDARKALENIKSYYGSKSIEQSCEQLVIELLPIFYHLSPEELETLKGKVFLPDTKNVLHKSCDLVFNDVAWAPMEETSMQVSEKLPRDLAIILGVQLVRSKILEQYISKKPTFRGVSFGQHEELTRRIQNIIRDYPFDETVLKELLQNADDAKATKMYIILDRRTHGKSSVISEEWQELQGPALLVWNDSVFTEKDLEGIQQLGLGSKRSEAETIGQYGIGFNVVYHLTDCPSFITNGDTLCVLDPHCRYVPEAKETLPGARYDELKNGFWKEFTDMSSAYLQNRCYPRKFQEGSLFRLPIRHTVDMIKSSKIVDTSDSDSVKPLSVEHLSCLLKQWMPMIKQAMFFLNHVTEIKYIEINEAKDGFSVERRFHFKTEITVSAASRKAFQDGVSNFTSPANNRSHILQYPLTVTEFFGEAKPEKQEKWLIQQGVGDIHNESQHWEYVHRVKPKHGIAAPLQPSKTYGKTSGQLFCFLPLPLDSGVPVHINGSFVLHSSRRSLWRNRNPKGLDDRSRWNVNLFKAIASSYANFLEQARAHYLKSAYNNWKQALSDLNNYYHLFPYFPVTEIKEKWDSLPCEVYRILVQTNAKVLCVLVSNNERNSAKLKLTVEWHPLTSKTKADQVYFWTYATSSDRKIIHPVLQTIGMKITSAPDNKMDCINRVMAKLSETAIPIDNAKAVVSSGSGVVYEETHSNDDCKKIPSVSPNSVFKYYTEHSEFSSSRGMQPRPIKKTPFKNADNFLLFVKYLVKMRLQEPDTSASVPPPGSTMRLASSFSSGSTTPYTRSTSIGYSDNIHGHHSFPEPPFSHFLLLSADGLLRRFEKEHKPLNFEHYELFPSHLNMFLHPAMKVVKFDHSYFITSEDAEHKQTVEQILSIFEDSLPHELHHQKVVCDASSIITKERLSKYWKCFVEAQVLTSFLSEILQHWALLLTTDNRLFSTASEVIPTYLPPETAKELIKKVTSIMRYLKIPFLDTAVVTAEVECPTLSDHDKILTYFYHANMNEPLTSTIRQTCHIDVLISYFASEAKPSDDLWVSQISSLPFFEDVMGTYSPIIANSTYIWPASACDIGYSSWIRGHNVLFLKAGGNWLYLGSAQQLKVRRISAEQLYTRYIFPSFDLLKEDERYRHLQHINLKMYSVTNLKYYKDVKISRHTSDEERSKISDAKSFINELTNLRCIGPDYSTLQPISAFCDYKVEIFKVFSGDKEFQMLPKQLQKESWLEFFKELGLKQTLTKSEYLDLCSKTANGKVKKVRECSDVLLKYLFSGKIRELWSQEKVFLNQVSRIAFAITRDTSSVDWIVRGKCQANQLVQLNGAASVTLMKHVWTVRPIIHLPEQCYHWYPDQETTLMLTHLNVQTTAIVSDVIANLQNICGESSYAEETLFNNYPGHLIAPEGTSLLSILQENLRVVNAKMRSENFQAHTIKNLPCIPVYCYCPKEDKKKMVLVKPSSVLSYGCSVSEYYPYLHCIPVELKDLMSLLTEIGVKSSLEPYHMQIVLEKIFHHSEGSILDPNAKESVKKAVQFLCPRLATLTQNAAETLTPLYLPDVNNELKLSTEMLYCDTPSYFGHMKLNLGGTPYSHFDIIEDSYGVAALDLCRLLPEGARPFGMSVKCKQVPGEECASVDHTDTSSSIERMLLESNPLAIVKAYKKFIPNETNIEDLECLVEDFFSSLEVITKQSLHSQIVLRKSGEVIGRMKSDFYLESQEMPRVLYISDEFDDEEDIVTEIIEHLYIDISQKFPFEVQSSTKTRLLNLITKYFKAKPSKKQEILDKYRIEVKSVPKKSSFSFALGEEIPEYYHHRLDQHPHNVFRAMEYVGYEEKENRIIVAQVVHLVSGDSDQLTATYCIYTHKEDEEGKEVSVLDLYKFLTGTKKTRASVDSALVPCTGDSEVTGLRRSLYEGDLADIKERVRKELKEIWKLDKELRNKAIRRLYLKWHPDKNLEDTERAEEIFQFLISEIERLERIDETEPEEEVDGPRDYQHTNFRHATHNFGRWNRTAKRNREAHFNEEDHSSNPFEQVNEQKKPEEGRRWVKQAETDYKILCDVHSKASTSNGYGHVCFMAHQVVEKALKGGVYALCGMDGRGLTDHNLTRHAYALRTVEPEQTQELHLHTSPLESYYLDTRYPNRWDGYMDIPSDHYDLYESDEAKRHAKAALDTVISIMP